MQRSQQLLARLTNTDTGKKDTGSGSSSNSGGSGGKGGNSNSNGDNNNPTSKTTSSTSTTNPVHRTITGSNGGKGGSNGNGGSGGKGDVVVSEPVAGNPTSASNPQQTGSTIPKDANREQCQSQGAATVTKAKCKTPNQ